MNVYNNHTESLSKDSTTKLQNHNTRIQLVLRRSTDFALFNYLDLFKKIPTTASHFKIDQKDGFKVTEIICSYLKAFFDKHLRKIQSDLIEKDNEQNRYIVDFLSKQ